MNYTLVLDSSAAIPEYVLEQRPINVLPITIRIDDHEFPDIVKKDELLEIYRSGKVSVGADIDFISQLETWFMHGIARRFEVLKQSCCRLLYLAK